MILRIVILCVSATFAIAQKTDAIIPSIGFPAAYRLSCAGVSLPRDAYLLRVTVTARNCDGVGLRAVPTGWLSLFSQHEGESSLALYPAPRAPLEQRRALTSQFDQIILVYPREVEDEAIEPVVRLEFEYWDLKAGDAVLRIDRFRLVEKVLEPNQTPQRNAGSRPFSRDSSASETPSSFGPRG